MSAIALHYEDKIQNLNDEDRYTFELKVAWIVSKALEVEKKPKKKLGWSGIVQTNDTSEMDALVAEYVDICGMSAIEKELFQHSFRKHQDVPITYELTECCEKPEIVLGVEYAVCAMCGRKVNGSDQLSANFTDVGTAPNATINLTKDNVSVVRQLSDETKVEKTKILSEPLLRIQGIKCSSFSLNDWHKIYDAVTDGVKNISQISHAHVDRTLHKHKFTKYYNDSPIIWEHITGNKIPPIPEGVLWVIQNVMSPHLANGHISIDQQGATYIGEKQRTSGKPFLYRCLHLCGCKEHLHLIENPKGSDTTQKVNETWRKYCQSANWKYYAV